MNDPISRRLGEDLPDLAVARTPEPVVTAAGIALRLRRRGRDALLPLPSGAVVIGRSPGCDVVVDGAGVAPRHARLETAGQQVVVEALAGAEVRVNGIGVRRATLRATDVLQIGDAELHLVADGGGRVTGSLTAAGRASTGNPPAPGPAAAAATSEDLDAVWAPLLEALYDWSRSGATERRGAMLAQLATATGARAAALLARRQGAPLLVLAASGDLGDLDAPRLTAHLVAVDEGSLAERGVDGTTLSLAVLSPRPSESLALALWSDQGAIAGAGLRLALRLFAHDELRDGLRRPPRLAGLPSLPSLAFSDEVVVGRSPAMHRLYREVAIAVASELPVLVTGETGAGKEHVARLLHDSSPRRERPFVTINCAAIPAELLEAELFGIGRGVATGVSERRGKFREAHGGTLFLDEVGELPLGLQAKLLRALEEKQVRPVGGVSSPVDLRVVAATNLDLAAAAELGRFRSDLYFRLAGFVLRVPALRERREDIPLLFGDFLRREAREGVALTPAAMAALLAHRWSGNVRELRHEAARAAARSAGGVVDREHLSPAIPQPFEPPATEPADLESGPLLLAPHLERTEAQVMAAALRRARGNLSEAARQLGVSRPRLRRRLRHLRLQ
jgi:DNA-binding NtrC family response regulator